LWAGWHCAAVKDTAIVLAAFPGASRDRRTIGSVDDIYQPLAKTAIDLFKTEAVLPTIHERI
jgi:hypothetical protein